MEMRTNEEIVKDIRKGVDVTDNMEVLWKQNKGLIWKIANKYKGYEDLEDLRQQGYIGLFYAAEHYNEDIGTPFVAYATYWIKQAIVRYIENSGRVVRISVAEQQKQRQYKMFLQEFMLKYGRRPQKREICDCLNISDKELDTLQRVSAMTHIESLNCYVYSEDDETTIGDMVADPVDIESDVLTKIEHEQLKHILWDAVDSLKAQQGQVLRFTFQENKSLKEIGLTIGVSTERVRVIKNKALRELEESDKRQQLMAFLPHNIEGIAYRHNGAEEFSRTWTSSTELAAIRLCNK